MMNNSSKRHSQFLSIIFILNYYYYYYYYYYYIILLLLQAPLSLHNLINFFSKLIDGRNQMTHECRGLQTFLYHEQRDLALHLPPHTQDCLRGRGDSHKKKTRVLETLKRSLKRHQDPVLRVWLEMFFSPKRYQF